MTLKIHNMFRIQNQLVVCCSIPLGVLPSKWSSPYRRRSWPRNPGWQNTNNCFRNLHSIPFDKLLWPSIPTSKRPSLNSLITLLKRLQSLCWARSLGQEKVSCPLPGLRGCLGIPMPPRLIIYHGPPSSLVPHSPCFCPASILPRCKLLETRPPSKFPVGGAAKWSSRAEPYIPAPPSL